MKRGMAPMTSTESEILQGALDWHAGGRAVALCTVVETWGSSPKPVGSHLIVDGDGAFLGSVSGGCVEGDVIVEAIDVIGSSRPRVLEFGVSNERAWQAGLTCGGRVKVLAEKLDDRLASHLASIVRAGRVSRPAVLVTALDGRPHHLLEFSNHSSHPMALQVAETFRTGKSRLVAPETFLLALMPPTRLVVFGAVHIAQALAPVAKLAGLEMMIVDPRSAFATVERFPDVPLVTAWPSDAAADLKLASTDAVAALSHDPRIDDEGLRLALDAGCFYIGALGSHRSHARRIERLQAAGIAEQDVKRIHAPIGLTIGAQGPAEIAVAIVAQIISVRRGMSFDAEAAAA